nr:hypothetical protein [uncultured Lichenicoccus sp.]
MSAVPIGKQAQRNEARRWLRPLEHYLYGVKPKIRHLVRFSLHRCVRGHGISRLLELLIDRPKTKRLPMMRSVAST